VPILVRSDSHSFGRNRASLLEKTKCSIRSILLRNYDAGLYVGKWSRQYFIDSGVDPASLYFTPHCVDSDWFRSRSGVATRKIFREKLGIAPDKKVVAFAGKLVSGKRPMDVIAAAHVLQLRGICTKVLFAGDGPLRHELQNFAAEKGVDAHFLGFCNQSEMPKVYAAADVLVIPSERETWGLVANEAVVCGCPVVASDMVGCGPDLLSEKGCGLIFPVGNVSGLADAVSEILGSTVSEETLTMAGNFYSPNASAESILDAARSVVGRQ
ncbi:glycosyltransferase family 4 protein, partial [Nostoc sp. NIES-2111]